MLSIKNSKLVAPRYQHDGAVEFVHIIKKNRRVHGSWGRHLVILYPGREILVPLPNVAIECHLSVYLELVYVHGFAIYLHDGFHYPRVPRELRKRVAVHMGREVRPNDVTRFLPNVLGPALRI